MTRQEAIQRHDFENVLIAESGDFAKGRRAAELLCRHGKTYARIQEGNCNGPGDFASAAQIDRWQAAFEKREAQLEARIKAIVAELGPGFGVVLSGDPRGVTVKVVVPSGKTDDWGKEGICVPTA